MYIYIYMCVCVCVCVCVSAFGRHNSYGQEFEYLPVVVGRLRVMPCQI